MILKCKSKNHLTIISMRHPICPTSFAMLFPLYIFNLLGTFYNFEKKNDENFFLFFEKNSLL